MIHLERGTVPSGLADHSTKWLEELDKNRVTNPAMSADEFWKKIRTRKAMKEFAAYLVEVFQKKCVYCESTPGHVSALNIEHFRPKSMSSFENLMFNWDNWLSACANCNTAKGTYWEVCDGLPCLIDPSSEYPEHHVEFINAQIVPISNRGQKTIKQLRLRERIDLLDERGKWLNYIRSLLVILVHVPEAAHSARSLLIWSMQDNAPYAAMTRSYLRGKVPRLANPGKPHQTMTLDEPIRLISELIESNTIRLQNID